MLRKAPSSDWVQVIQVSYDCTTLSMMNGAIVSLPHVYCMPDAHIMVACSLCVGSREERRNEESNIAPRIFVSVVCKTLRGTGCRRCRIYPLERSHPQVRCPSLKATCPSCRNQRSEAGELAPGRRHADKDYGLRNW